MANSPMTDQSDLVTIQVKSNGNPINDSYQVMSVRVESAVNSIPYCIVEIADGSASEEGFPISDSSDFIPGAEIEVLAGYHNDNSSIFNGIVTKQALRIDQKSGSVLSVVCKDKSIKMAVGRKNACFQNTSDSSIISQLIQNYGLQGEVESTTNELKEVIQYYATDWDFMLARADINGMVTLVHDGVVSVKDPDELNEEVLTVTYGYDLLEFNAELDAESQFKSVKSSAWDMAKQEIKSGDSSASNSDIGNISSATLSEVIGLDSYELQSGGFIEPDSLNTWAHAQSTKSKYAMVRGSVKFQGSAVALPGKILELKGVGQRFSGKGFISGIKHKIANGSWITTARIGLSPDWVASKVQTEAPPASGLLPSIQGLQIGKVKQIEGDPDGEFRVLVSMPLVQSDDEGVWARMSTFYAGAQGGAFFYPEVDDEVVLGFFNDDPRYPVILGSMFSSGRASSETPDEQNMTKSFVSREKMKISFDEEKRIVSITTPANNKLTLDDDTGGIEMSDQNGNSIKLSSSGIEIKSTSNLQITAVQNVSLSGTTGISGKAEGGTIDLACVDMKCQAESQMDLNAGASLSASSSGELSIQAAMVMIN